MQVKPPIFVFKQQTRLATATGISGYWQSILFAWGQLQISRRGPNTSGNI